MCTNISYKSTDGDEFFARTQEYFVEYDFAGVQFPRNYEVPIAASNWTTKYSVMGVGVLYNDQMTPAVLDGINEYGLSVVSHYFADEYDYATLEEIKEAGKMPVCPEQFIFYLLSMCKDVDDVKETLQKVSIPNFSLVQSEALPQHFCAKDASGKSIIIEPSVKLGFNVFDNEVGVMTNNPTYDWHLKNLRNYTFLSDHNAPDRLFGTKEIKSFGKGSGLLGMPGDYTSPSRFVRAAALLQFSEPTDTKHSVNKGFHILDTSDIVRGEVKLEDGVVHFNEYSAVYNLSRRELYVRLYDDFTIQKMSFNDELVEGDSITVYPLQKEPHYQELQADK